MGEDGITHEWVDIRRWLMYNGSIMEGCMVYKGVNYSESRPGRDKRFKPDAPKKTWQVAKIWDQHEEVIRRITLGQKNVEIAESMKLSPTQVSNIRNSPIIQDRLAIMKGARDAYTLDVAQDIREFAPIALNILKALCQGTDGSGLPVSPALKAKVATDLLDRAGHAPTRQISVQSVHAHLTKDDIEELKRRAFTTEPVIEVS